ncbi:S-layer homology domain-containing protein [Megamonas funiformis]|uniref:S-layer homology domain-containing protein n=1 Tax=Megamonas funiformis TaxID=437897 RepID=A0AAW4U835_9FIRM|nr:S-layer homology domain-containing protein [Megamonas funiformis]MCB6829500.1 S-layer homology domain-containing protein [Megamonas funiformis]
MSKKTLVSAITAALVVGAASTTFAAANPFSDVPADSWAYDAVTTLAADGVIDGYPDGTYKGQNTMTRYEMAQIVARAMAKTDLEKADKALVDKLAAEFAEELDNLGVRVADLEKKSDNVKWGGELRYRYYDIDRDSKAGDETHNKVLFRLEPKAYIGNSGWTANARLDYEMNLSSDENDNNVEVDRAYVEGPLFGATVTAGRTPVFTAQGLLFDDRISGGTVAFGSDEFKTTLAAGRYNRDHDDADTTLGENVRDITAEYYGVQFDYTPNDNLALNAGYTALTGIDVNYFNNLDGMARPAYGDDNTANIWYVGGKYAFDKNVAFVGEYAQNTDADDEDQAWTAELQYKGANPADAGSWGMYAGYRQIEAYASIAPTYDDIIGAGYKGAVVGASYVPAENILATIQYFDGEETVSGQDASKFFANVDFFF